MRAVVPLVMLLCGVDAAAAQYALSPLPPLSPSACQVQLAKLASFKPLPAIAGSGDCVAADVVLLQSIRLADQAKLAIVPPATLRCTMAQEVARWVRDDVAPALQVLAGAASYRLDELDSYDCRTQNHIAGARVSEHGRANALDVRDFRLANGKVLALTDVKVIKAWRDILRGDACGRFSTVLGPGADGYHEEHIHLDLAERRGNYKICEWAVREPPAAGLGEPVPLPRPRPPVKVGGGATTLR